ncbi:anhydro-N-acetylmuramic acid kinase [Allorhizocola rhizosphaerae]|uniref:anhydro-N-acetylmuramic acid kinase n=1 Tax=Allorhizocola rhizosphaerae TaxID=1872709 RepID=UPI000E3C72FB|nr:anhydro-N-acetylmuramic acid kinase [Allorhizocola rhizosphaerae]
MRVLGLISGTSHDGIDWAVVDFALSGDTLVGRVESYGTTPYPSGLRSRLLRALPPAAVSLREVCELDTLIGQAFATVARSDVDLICSHGQTVYHWAGRGTLQIGQPAWIAERTGVPVVSDVRARDIAAGGHGAPLVPVLDRLLLAGLAGRVAALNIGGIANITVLDPLVAYDIGPGNALIDAMALRLTGAHYDEDGRLAAAGTVDRALLDRLLADPYYALPPPKSTGKEHFNAAYVSSLPPTADTIATLTALTASTIASSVREHGIETLVVSGGGWANSTLMGMLRGRLEDVRIVPSDEFGAPSDAKEAIAFALIGWLTVHGLASTTRILGSITPGAGALQLPPPLAAPPARLHLEASNA